MTPQQPERRSDQPIEIGPRHGYRIEADHAFINAEFQVPPYRSGKDWSLELWATEQPYQEGPLAGVKVAQLALDLPTPIGPYVHRVDARTAARLPLQGRAYSMVLALVDPESDGPAGVCAFANYPESQTFSAPHLEGAVSYAIHGPEVVLQADGIVNPRAISNLSGTLSLELWAFPESGPSTEGLRLAACEIERVPGQSRLAAIESRVAFSEPSVGRFRLAMLLCEWTLAHGYVARDRRDFASHYERSAPETVGSIQARSAAPPAPAVTVSARPADRLRLMPTAEPEIAEAQGEVPPPSLTLTSIQTGSLDELARVKGLNLKLAREIIKARPFASLADLIRVRGIGQKTVDRIKGLVRL